MPKSASWEVTGPGHRPAQCGSSAQWRLFKEYFRAKFSSLTMRSSRSAAARRRSFSPVGGSPAPRHPLLHLTQQLPVVTVDALGIPRQAAMRVVFDAGHEAADFARAIGKAMGKSRASSSRGMNTTPG